jgi:hypothetical protein
VKRPVVTPHYAWQALLLRVELNLCRHSGVRTIKRPRWIEVTILVVVVSGLGIV